MRQHHFVGPTAILLARQGGLIHNEKKQFSRCRVALIQGENFELRPPKYGIAMMRPGLIVEDFGNYLKSSKSSAGSGDNHSYRAARAL